MMNHDISITIYINNMNRKWQSAAHATPKSLRLFSATLHSRITGLIWTMFKYVCRRDSSWVSRWFLRRALAFFFNNSSISASSCVTFLTFRKAGHMEFAVDFTSFHCTLARHNRVKIMLGWAINKVDISGHLWTQFWKPSWSLLLSLQGPWRPYWATLINLVCYSCLPLWQEICLHYYDVHTYMYSFLLSLRSQIS